MKFSKREDIEAPVAAVFREMTDFEGFTRAGLRRGADVKRVDSLTEPGPGMAWAVRAVIRGRARDISIRVIRYEPGQNLVCAVDSGGLLGTFSVEFLELSRTRTRLNIALELRAATMTSRLMLQSARLAKGALDKRFAKRIRQFVSMIEERQSVAALRG